MLSSTVSDSNIKHRQEDDVDKNRLMQDFNRRRKRSESLLTANSDAACLLWDKPKVAFGMFAYQTGVKHVMLKNVESTATFAFSGCVNLLSVHAPQLKYIGLGSFISCFALGFVDTPNVLKLGKEAFRRCHTLEMVNFPLVVEVLKNSFKECFALTVAKFPVANLMGEGAFRSCVSLSDVVLPEAVHFGPSVFNNCRSLRNISLPKAIFDNDSRFIFSGCSSLETVSLPATEYLPMGAFSGCGALSKLVLGGNRVVKIDSITSVFADCNNYDFERPDLRNQVYNYDYSSGNKPKPKPVDQFPNGKAVNIKNDSNNTGVIYVPDNLVEAYKKDEKWSELASQIKGVSEMPSSSEDNN